eukprot:TRINITY_DN11828_c0_g1_i2.p1 TRINITY_DN11828_c0_g1~~TRINITY_DN11828_c0_g1_i2.p1  ORF type:complete len:292 (-),score=99.57 TRINITY_DN11828_c0_g1_i2:74-949(-)
MSFGDQLESGHGPPSSMYSNRPVPSSFDSRSPASATSAIRSSIARLGDNVNQMNRMVSQLGTHRDTHELRTQLRETRRETSAMVRQTKDSIQLLSNPTSYQNSDWRIQQDRLRKDFEAELKRLKDVSTRSIELEKAFVAKVRGRSPHTATSEDDRRLLEQEEKRSLLEAEQEHQREQQSIQMDNMIQYNENLIAERDEEVKAIERDVHEINDIFKDLAVMVTDQGAKLGNIEDYIITTADNTQAASEEVGQAYVSQSKARKRSCLLVVILLIAILLLVLIVSHSLESSDVK